jgi:protease IV
MTEENRANSNFVKEQVPSMVDNHQQNEPPGDDGFIKGSSNLKDKNMRSGCCLGVLITVGIIIFLAIIGFIGLFVVKALFKDTFSFSSSQNGNQFEEKRISGESSSNNKIVVLHINGVIMGGRADSNYDSASGGDASSLCRRLKKLEKDTDMKALILYINTPGGEVVAADRVYHAVMKLKKKRKIPVVAWFDSMAASGGYYIGCSADWIVSHELCTTGSIGVVISTYKYYELFKKIGLQSEPYTSGKLKDILSGARPTTPEEKQIINEYLMLVYDRFLEVVVKGRKDLTLEKIKHSEIADARIFLGIQAKKLKLVDQLGYFDDAVTKAASLAKIKDYKVVVSRPKLSFLSLFGIESKAPQVNVNLPGSAQTPSSKVKLEPGKLYYIMPR